jgi:Sec-independent protein secretion pathway component TatC
MVNPYLKTEAFTYVGSNVPTPKTPVFILAAEVVGATFAPVDEFVNTVVTIKLFVLLDEQVVFTE